MQSPKDVKGSDRLPRQLGVNIIGDTGETQNLDVQHFSGRLHGLKILAAVVAQAQIQLVSFNRFPDGVIVPVELVSDGRADKDRPIGEETFLNQKINMAKIDIPEVDGDLLTVCSLRPKFMYVRRHLYHPITI